MHRKLLIYKGKMVSIHIHPIYPLRSSGSLRVPDLSPGNGGMHRSNVEND